MQQLYTSFQLFKHQFISLEMNSVIIKPWHKRKPKCLSGAWGLTTLGLMWYGWDPNSCGKASHTTQPFDLLLSSEFIICLSLQTLARTSCRHYTKYAFTNSDMAHQEFSRQYRKWSQCYKWTRTWYISYVCCF